MATKGAQLCLRKQWLFEVAFFQPESHCLDLVKAFERKP